jgi:hypothetical protein
MLKVVRREMKKFHLFTSSGLANENWPAFSIFGAWSESQGAAGLLQDGGCDRIQRYTGD